MASKLNFDVIGAGFLWLVTIVCVSSCTSIASATQPCHQFFVQKQVAYVAPVYAAPVYYQAGKDIEAEALAEKVARLAVPKIIAQLSTAQVKQQTTPQSAISQHCSKCHSGAAPKAGLVLDGVTELACSQITKSLRALASEEMPKDHKISPEVKGAIMQELLDLERKEVSQ